MKQDASYKAVKNLIDQGYKKIAFLGGPAHLTVFKTGKGLPESNKGSELLIPLII